MKTIFTIFFAVLMLLPCISTAQSFKHDTLYIEHTGSNLSGSPYNYLYNTSDEFKDYKLTFNVLESEESWGFAYSDWCCDIVSSDIPWNYSVPLEANDSSFVKVGVFWNGQPSGYGVVEVIFTDLSDNANQDTAIFIIDEAPTSTGQLLTDHFELFPNPTSSNLTVEGIDHCFEVDIYDNVGKLIFTQSCRDTNEIHTSGLMPGLYFARFKDSKQTIIGNASFIRL